jgi:hypothetical protein
MKKEKRRDNNKIIEFVFTNREKYEKQLINCRKWKNRYNPTRHKRFY